MSTGLQGARSEHLKVSVHTVVNRHAQSDAQQDNTLVSSAGTCLRLRVLVKLLAFAKHG